MSRAGVITVALIIAILLLVASIVAVFYFAVPLDVQNVRADITIGHKTAFRLTNDSIMHFGTIGLTNTATRSITITDIRSHPISATIYTQGPGWLTVSSNRILIKPGRTTNVTFTAAPPNGTAYGNYSWNITVVYRRR